MSTVMETAIALDAMRVQKDLLIHELCHTRELESKLQEQESKFVSLLHENSMLKKAVSLQSHSFADSNFVGCFVLKKFGQTFYFGIVSCFVDPWYQVCVFGLITVDILTQQQVVYEDADFEEITPRSLEAILWTDIIPDVKRILCLKHKRSRDNKKMQLAVADKPANKRRRRNATGGFSTPTK
jgi:hypothetical protein